MTLFERLYTTFYRRVWILSQKFEDESAVAKENAFHLCFLDSATLGAYVSFRPEQEKEAVKRRETGHLAVLVFQKDRVVGSAWAAVGRAYIPYLNRDILLGSGELYMYDAFTHPDYRQRGVAGIRNKFLVSEARKMGYKRASSIVAFENKVGLHSSESFGYRKVGVFSCIRLGVGQVDFVRPYIADVPSFVRPFKGKAD